MNAASTQSNLTLLVAPTRSLAGTVQVVARSVETALHKLHTLRFDLQRVVSGCGFAPLPPVAADDLTGIGRTNDAVLYGGDVTLWVRGDDDSLEAIGPQVPSSASRDYGQPFGEIFERYGRDFYKIDPLLFSPAVVTFVNLDTGRYLRFGEPNPPVLASLFRRLTLTDALCRSRRSRQLVSARLARAPRRVVIRSSRCRSIGSWASWETRRRRCGRKRTIGGTSTPCWSARCRRVRSNRSCSAWMRWRDYEAAGGVVVNPPRAVEAAVDKYLTSARLQAAGLDTPRTVVCQTSRRRGGGLRTARRRCRAQAALRQRRPRNHPARRSRPGPPGLQDARPTRRRPLLAGIRAARRLRSAVARHRRRNVRHAAAQPAGLADQREPRGDRRGVQSPTRR